MSKDEEKDKETKKKEALKKRDAREAREDKIFNNGYKTGEGLRDDSEYNYQTSIKVNSNYSDNYLKDVYEYEEHLDYNLGVTRIFELIEEDRELRMLLHKIDANIKIKLTKEQINWSFNRILELMKKDKQGEQFYNPIYVLEALSSILNINSQDPVKDYKKIFDSLEVELQEELVIELNQKYNFLNGKMVKRRMH